MLDFSGLLKKVDSPTLFPWTEMARAALANNCDLVESPITFVERVSGVSKMSRAIVIEALWRVTLWGLNRGLGRSADKLHYVK